MRSYANRQSYKGLAAKYKQQRSKEWDLGLRLLESNYEAEIERVIEHFEDNLDRLSYVLVSGIECNSSQLYHVHCCFISKLPLTRYQVLTLIDREKYKHQYCAVRNPKYSYTAWKCHHTKDDTKIDERRILFEYGTLPDEVLTKQQYLTAKKFGYEGPAPLIQQKIKREAVPKCVKTKSPVVKVVKEKKTRVLLTPEQRKIHASKNQHEAKRTPEACAKAATRLLHYSSLYLIADTIEEQERLSNIISNINKDYFD